MPVCCDVHNERHVPKTRETLRATEAVTTEPKPMMPPPPVINEPAPAAHSQPDSPSQRCHTPQVVNRHVAQVSGQPVLRKNHLKRFVCRGDFGS